jgi:hypothetical protein
MAGNTRMDRHFHLGSDVQCLDGRAGTLRGLALYGPSLIVTHLIVQRALLGQGEVAVPMDRVIVPLGEHVFLGLVVSELESTTTVPEGAGQLSWETWVACERERIGTLDCVLVDPKTHRVTYLIMRQGLLLSRDIGIPASWIQRIEGHRVILSATRQAMGRLRRFATHRDAAYIAQSEQYDAGG